jgi:hypothetical protein
VDELEEFWNDILGEEPLRVVAAWLTLDLVDQAVVRDHLNRMATEDGWTEGQQQAARTALRAIADDADGGSRRPLNGR